MDSIRNNPTNDPLNNDPLPANPMIQIAALSTNMKWVIEKLKCLEKRQDKMESKVDKVIWLLLSTLMATLINLALYIIKGG